MAGGCGFSSSAKKENSLPSHSFIWLITAGAEENFTGTMSYYDYDNNYEYDQLRIQLQKM